MKYYTHIKQWTYALPTKFHYLKEKENNKSNLQVFNIVQVPPFRQPSC